MGPVHQKAIAHYQKKKIYHVQVYTEREKKEKERELFLEAR